MPDMKIDQQSNSDATHTKVGEQLSVMYWQDLRRSLQLDNHAVVYQKIDPISNAELHVLVRDLERPLYGDEAASLSKLVSKTGLICAFQKPRAQC